MPVITLVALNDALGGTLPARARLIATASKVRTSGPTVTLPKRIILDIVGGVPIVPLNLAATAVDWGWSITLADLNTLSLKVERFVAVPNVAGPIDWGDLVDVDPETLAPDADPEAAWWLEIATQDAFDLGAVAGVINLAAYKLGDVIRLSATGNITLGTLPVPPAAKAGTVTLRIVGNGFAITWGGQLSAYGVKPQLTPGATPDLFNLFYDGLTWWVMSAAPSGAPVA